MLKIVAEGSTGEELLSALDEICREGVRPMLAAAWEVEADEYIVAVQDQLDEVGRRLVVRNGHPRARTITTAAGAVDIQAPRVNDRRVDPDYWEAHGIQEWAGAAAVSQEHEGGRGVAVAVPARATSSPSSGPVPPSAKGCWYTVASSQPSSLRRPSQLR